MVKRREEKGWVSARMESLVPRGLPYERTMKNIHVQCINAILCILYIYVWDICMLYIYSQAFMHYFGNVGYSLTDGGGRLCKSNNHNLIPNLEGVIHIPMKGYIVKNWGMGLSNSAFYLSRTWTAKAHRELLPLFPIHNQIPGLPCRGPCHRGPYWRAARPR